MNGKHRTDSRDYSVAGLLAARVLSDHFENVIMIEPDTELYEKRTRVGQWCHPHSLSLRLRILLLHILILRRSFSSPLPVDPYAALSKHRRPGKKLGSTRTARRI
jgi:hypothetical protein